MDGPRPGSHPRGRAPKRPLTIFAALLCGGVGVWFLTVITAIGMAFSSWQVVSLFGSLALVHLLVVIAAAVGSRVAWWLTMAISAVMAVVLVPIFLEDSEAWVGGVALAQFANIALCLAPVSRRFYAERMAFRRAALD